MNWVEVCTIVGVNIALFGILTSVMIWMVNKIDNDVKNVGDRLDGWMKHSIAIQAEQSKRTDQLYQMFVDLLKEQRK